MLKQRVVTAIFLIPLVLAAIFALPANWFLVLLALIFLGGSWEYSRLAGFAGSATGYLLPVIQAILFFVLFQSSGEWHNDILVYLSFMCAAWLLMFFRLSFYHPGAQVTNNYRFVSFVTALVSITTGWLAISWIHIQPEGPWLILLLLLIVWAADTGAYFAGKNFGKRKLAKHISPGKTQAGLVGGLIAAPVVALLASSMMPITTKEPFSIVLVSLVAALVSVGGDLMISLHKRTSCIKDSGDLLPGHGGILDRLDSLMAAAPFFALALLLSGT